jgi:hypothetical protein
LDQVRRDPVRQEGAHRAAPRHRVTDAESGHEIFLS